MRVYFLKATKMFQWNYHESLDSNKSSDFFSSAPPLPLILDDILIIGILMPVGGGGFQIYSLILLIALSHVSQHFRSDLS